MNLLDCQIGNGPEFGDASRPDLAATARAAGDSLFDVAVARALNGEVRSESPEGIACWFIDTDYNEESFFARHAYFLGANGPYQALKAEINAEAWDSLHSDTSRLFDRPKSDRIAVKVINHLGDEVLKVFRASETWVWTMRQSVI